MLKNFNRCVALAGFLLCSIPGRAVNSAETSSTVLTGNGAEQFQDGDRVVVIGDSITCGSLYPTLLQVFYATRYPTRDIYQDIVESAMAYIGDRKKYEADLETLHASICRRSRPITHSFKIERSDGTK